MGAWDENSETQDEELILMINHEGEGRSPEGSEREVEHRVEEIHQDWEPGLVNLSKRNPGESSAH